MIRYNVEEILGQIYEATIKFLVPLNPHETYKIVTDEGRKLIGAKFATIFLAKKDKLILSYTSLPSFYKLSIHKNGYAYKAFKKGLPTAISIQEYRKTHPETPKNKIKTIFYIPLTNQDETIGVINLYSEKTYFHKKKILKTLQLYGSLASLAIRKAELYTEAKEGLDARNLFISMASHELRTPLTTINGYAQLLHQKLAKKEVPPKRWVEALQFETLRLRRLVNELLQVDQIKTGKFQYSFKYLNITDVLRQAIIDVKFKYPENKVNFTTKIDNAIIHGDYDKLLQVFINILNNAAKFSGAKKEINVFLKGNGNYVMIVINDKGKGIPFREQKHIFEEFFRGSNMKTDGIGMGLFIGKKIIDEHKGFILIRSKINSGTSVEIKLPKIKISKD